MLTPLKPKPPDAGEAKPRVVGVRIVLSTWILQPAARTPVARLTHVWAVPAPFQSVIAPGTGVMNARLPRLVVDRISPSTCRVVTPGMSDRSSGSWISQVLRVGYNKADRSGCSIQRRRRYRIRHEQTVRSVGTYE